MADPGFFVKVGIEVSHASRQPSLNTGKRRRMYWLTNSYS